MAAEDAEEDPSAGVALLDDLLVDDPVDWLEGDEETLDPTEPSEPEEEREPRLRRPGGRRRARERDECSKASRSCRRSRPSSAA